MTVFGWDASDFDWDRGPMDLAAARRDGIDFFTHKATEGTSVRHWRCGEALTRARDAGIPFLGAYIVIRTGAVSPQVDYFLAHLDVQAPWWREFPGFFFQVDLEHWSYDAVAWQQGVACAELLRERTGKWVVLYAPQWAYGDTIGGSDPLWASAYGANPAGHYRALYPGDGDAKRWRSYSGRSPVFLQYGSQAIIGSQTNCDANAFRGTVDDLGRLIVGDAYIPDGGGFAPFPEEDDMVKLINVNNPDHPDHGKVFKVYPTDLGMAREHLEHPESLDPAVKLYGGQVDVAFPDDFGTPLEQLRAKWAAMAGTGGTGPVTLSPAGVQQVHDAAFAAAQEAEDK